jgi:hypothetical protein
MREILIQQYRTGEETAVNFGCKALFLGRIMTVPEELVPGNFVPAPAVIRKGQALFGQIGRKGFLSSFLKVIN